MYKYINIENAFTQQVEKFVLKTNDDGSFTSFPAIEENPHYAEILKQVEAGTLTIAEAD